MPGPRKVYLGAALIAIAIAVVVVLAIRPGGGSSNTVPGLNLAATKHFGQTPKWLKVPEPKATTAVTASATHPQLHAMQGYPVDATLANGATTSIFMAGPTVPSWVAQQASANTLSSTKAVPSTFTVTFSKSHGDVPLAADQFTLLTYQGKILHPRVTESDGSPLPKAVPAGEALKLRLTTDVSEGDGTIRWAPDTKSILVGYFWTLEFD